MDVEVKLRNRILYKAEIYLLKIIPPLLALITLLNSTLSYFFDIDLHILSYIGGISVIPMIFLYISSYVFKFCNYHRIFLHYISVTWIINIIDYYVGIPLNDLSYLTLQMIVFGTCLFIALFLYVKSNKRSIIKNNR